MPLTQLVYYSRSKLQGAEAFLSDQLRSILHVSQANNTRDGLTGYLLFDSTWFIQILEGESATVAATYERIQGDPRHGEFVLVSRRDVRNRSFPLWSMGGSMIAANNRAILAGHGIEGSLDPARLLAPSILAIAMDLQDRDIAEHRDMRLAS